MAEQVHPFDRWLEVTVANHGRHACYSVGELHDSREGAFPDLLKSVRAHYVAPEVTAQRLADLGAPKTATLLLEYLPSSKTAKSGDLGEILATEFAEWHLSYAVPVRRLRWKDGRNMALRGDDIVAVDRAAGAVRFLKGECKSRVAFQASTMKNAVAALDGNHERPSRHSVLFVATRLRERGEDDLALELENALLASFEGRDVAHLLFVMCGNDPDALLSGDVAGRSQKARTRHAVGLRILDHQAFINRVFSEL